MNDGKPSSPDGSLSAGSFGEGGRSAAADVAAVGRISAVPSILNILLEMTGLGYGVVARVTPGNWTACAVIDRIGFGLDVGGELEVSSTLCSQVREEREPIVIEKASDDPAYRDHHTPKRYGIESYIAVPIFLRSGEVFGTLCAIDPRPSDMSDPRLVRTLELFAELIASELELGVTLQEQARILEHQALLINELNHRVKNTLTTVQSIASQSLRHANSVAEARETFESRLMALAKVHDVLTRSNWAGVEMDEIIREAKAPFDNQPSRFRLSGPSVRIAARQAPPISMTLHELLTNAVKYGALSKPDGEVEIAWTVQDATLSLRWTESGGPPVDAPTRRGFGMRLIQQALAAELGGSAKVSFAPGGVVCEVVAVLD